MLVESSHFQMYQLQELQDLVLIHQLVQDCMKYDKGGWYNDRNPLENEMSQTSLQVVQRPEYIVILISSNNPSGLLNESLPDVFVR